MSSCFVVTVFVVNEGPIGNRITRTLALPSHTLPSPYYYCLRESFPLRFSDGLHHALRLLDLESDSVVQSQLDMMFSQVSRGGQRSLGVFVQDPGGGHSKKAGKRRPHQLGSTPLLTLISRVHTLASEKEYPNWNNSSKLYTFLLARS